MRYGSIRLVEFLDENWRWAKRQYRRTVQKSGWKNGSNSSLRKYRGEIPVAEDTRWSRRARRQ